ncbi:hypothetical protein CsSME_00044658 [Camellia sinensis var. sinensis]
MQGEVQGRDPYSYYNTISGLDSGGSGPDFTPICFWTFLTTYQTQREDFKKKKKMQ